MTKTLGPVNPKGNTGPLSILGVQVKLDYETELIKFAHHQAGHAVLAAEFDIEIHSLSLVTIEGQPPGTRVAPLSRYTAESPNYVAFRERVEAYCQMLLAGPAAEMILAIQKWKAKGHGVPWERWQLRKIDQLFQDDDPDADYVFATIFGYSHCISHDGVLKRFKELWRQAEKFLRSEANWRRVQRLANALLELDTMTVDEALAVIQAA